MIDLELLSEHGGWESTAVPDDLKVRVRTGSETTTFHASLDEILRAYAHARDRRDGAVPVYTSALQLRFDDDSCRLTLNSIEVEVPTQNLRESTRELLASIFEAKDGSDPENRGEQLEAVQRDLVERDLEIDLFELYEDLVE
jgi:hypothetical protein